MLNKDIRIDDIEPLMQAIAMIKGVRKVTPEVADVSDHVATIRARAEVRQKILALLEELDNC